MYMLVALSIFTNHHVHPLSSTDFCKENGIPATAKNLSKCSSCAGRCGDIKDKNSDKSCSCGVLCMAYRECCGDFEFLCPVDYITAQSILQHYGGLRTKCLTVHEARYVGEATPTHTAMVTACSNDSVPCDFNFADGHSILTHGVPVVDILYGITFVNDKCAICNGIPLWRIRPLEASLLCHSQPVLDHNYVMDILSSNKSSALQNQPLPDKEDDVHDDFPLDPVQIVIDVLSSSECTPSFRLENSQRHCVPQIDTCPKSCTNTELIQFCVTAPQALVTTGRVTYRNIYCALCNHGRDIGFECGSMAVLGVSKFDLFSLSLLFDVNRDHGVLIKSMEAKCKDYNHGIPGGVKCGQIVCPVGYILTGQGCSKEQVEFETNVTSTYHIIIEALTSCNQTNNSDVVIAELRTAFMSALDGHLDVSRTNIRIKMSHTCLLTSNYSLDVFVSIRSHENLPQNISIILQNIGVKAVWNVFRGIFIATNTSGSTIWITSGGITFSNKNIKQTDCDGFFQTTYSSAFQNVFPQPENITFDFNKPHIDAFNYSAPTCKKNENKKITKVSLGLGYVTIVLSTISLFCFALRLILQAFYKPYHTSPGKMQFQLSLALALANVLLLTSPLADNIQHLCAILGALKHASFISSFCWMICISADIWRIFRPSNIEVNKDDPILKISVVTWAMPFAFSSAVFALDYIETGLPISPRFGGAICWFTNWVSLLAFFVVPVIASIIINVVLFTSVWIALSAAVDSAWIDQTAISRKRYTVYLKVFLLMGLTWSTLLLAVLLDLDAVWYIFVICNASQGCYMFLAFGPEKQWWMSFLDAITEFWSLNRGIWAINMPFLLMLWRGDDYMDKGHHENTYYTILDQCVNYTNGHVDLWPRQSLTQRGLPKMAAISQTTFSNTFSWTKCKNFGWYFN